MSHSILSHFSQSGLSQKELCDRLLLNYQIVTLSAKQLKKSTHEFLRDETGWVLINERYYPPVSESMSH